MQLSRSVLVPYSAEAMFDLIEQAESYPLFVPWCTGTEILERSDECVAARLHFSYLQLRFSIHTRNAKRRPEWLQVRLVEGPFRHFHGDWTLTRLADQGCKVAFALSYEISDGLLDRLARPAVELVCRSMMDAFVKRAEATLAPAASSSAALSDSTPRAPRGPPSHPAPPENTMPLPDTTCVEALRASPIAVGLSSEQSQVLAGLMSVQDCAVGELVGREGDVDDRLLVVVSGSLAVLKHRGTPDETQLAALRAGDLAHELGFLDGAPRYAALVATQAARVLVLRRDGLESLIDAHPRILYAVMCAIVRAVHAVQTRLSVQASELTNYVVKQHGRY